MAELTREDVIKFIENMTVLELSEFVKELEEKFGVSAAAPVGMAMGPIPGAAEAAPEAEKTEFDVILTGFGDKKIQVIKAVRELTNLGLKEGVPKEEAELAKKKIEEAGGTAEVK